MRPPNKLEYCQPIIAFCTMKWFNVRKRSLTKCPAICRCAISWIRVQRRMIWHCVWRVHTPNNRISSHWTSKYYSQFNADTEKKNESTSWYGKIQKKDCHLMSLLWNGGYRSFGRLTFKEKEGHRKKNSRAPLFFRKYTEPIKLCKHMPSVNYGVISNTKSMHLSVIPK